MLAPLSLQLLPCSKYGKIPKPYSGAMENLSLHQRLPISSSYKQTEAVSITWWQELVYSLFL